MKNYWTANEITAKGYPFWTFEIYDNAKNSIIPETVIEVDEKPQLKVIEQVEVIEGGRKVWKPICVIWEKFIATYNSEKFTEQKNHIRLLEVNGDTAGILRLYDKHGEHQESWVLHGLKLEDIDQDNTKIIAGFIFHHALYITN